MTDTEKLTPRQSMCIGGGFADLIFSMGITKTEANEAQSDEHRLWKNLRMAVEDSFESQAATRLNRPVNLDPRITIDRSVPLNFLKQNEEFLFPDLQETGPDEPDMNTLEHWIHPNQKLMGRKCSGQEILEHLMTSGDIRYCLGLREMRAIAARGADFFHYYLHFDHQNSNNYFAWKSIKKLKSGSMAVPYFYGIGNQVYERGRFLDGEWTETDFALLAPKPF